MCGPNKELQAHIVSEEGPRPPSAEPEAEEPVYQEYGEEATAPLLVRGEPLYEVVPAGQHMLDSAVGPPAPVYTTMMAVAPSPPQPGPAPQVSSFSSNIHIIGGPHDSRSGSLFKT